MTRSRFHPAGSWLLASLLIILLALLAVFVSREVLPASLRQDTPSDYKNHYLPTGRSIAEGKGPYRESGKIELAVPPGFPILIAGVVKLSEATGADFNRLMDLTNILLYVLSVLVLYAIARRLWGGLLGLIPPLLWLAYPFSLWLTQAANVEVPFFLFMYISVGLFFAGFRSERKVWFFALAGLFIGIAMLIRPIALLMGLMLAVLILLFERSRGLAARLGLALALLAGNLLAVLPWEMWVYARTGEVIPLSSNGSNSIRDGLTFAVETHGYRAFNLPPEVIGVMSELSERIPSRSPTSVLVSESLAVFREQPVAFIEFLLIKALRSWYGTDSGRGEMLIIPVQILFLTPILLGLFFAIRRRAVPRVVWVTVALSLLYFWGMTMMVVSILRYTTPIIGLGFLMAPGVVAAYLETRAARSARVRAVPAEPLADPAAGASAPVITITGENREKDR